MVPEGLRRLVTAGFTLVELTVVMAIAAVLVGVSLPFFGSFYQASKLRAAADEMATVLNGARYQALKQNTSVCVAVNGQRVQYRLGGCGGGRWLGPGTDAAGFIALQNTVLITGATANVVFTNLGAAAVGGTYLLRNPDDGRTLTVTVAGSGRVTIP